MDKKENSPIVKALVELGHVIFEHDQKNRDFSFSAMIREIKAKEEEEKGDAP